MSDFTKTLAYVCLSGGADSATCLAIAVNAWGSENVRAVSFDYGQRHIKEAEAAEALCAHYQVAHQVHKINGMKKTMLTDVSAEVPNISYSDIVGVSPTYVPFRNGLMLSTLAMLASPQPNSDNEAVIFFGAHAEDAANDAYPDCRLDFVGAIGAAIYIGSYHRVRVRAPLIELTKAQVIGLGYQMDVPYELTWSCYKGEELHCGTCPTCRARKQAFNDVGVPDPTQYAV